MAPHSHGTLLIVHAPPPSFDGSDKERRACTYVPHCSPHHPDHTQWEAGYDESVEVNQRALIDKVLARYSGEFTGTPQTPPPETGNLSTSTQYFANYCRIPMTLALKLLRFDLKPRNTLIEAAYARTPTTRPRPPRRKISPTSRLFLFVAPVSLSASLT